MQLPQENQPNVAGQNQTMRNYYQFQSKIYDLTRWSFLFGRKTVIRKLPVDTLDPVHIVEIGCGTGYNLARMARRFPAAWFTAYDVSADMIRLARKNTAAYQDRIKLIEAPFSAEEAEFCAPADIVLFSYSLTMINPQWSTLISLAVDLLKPGGHLAVVDFHASAHPWFKKHMGKNHVRMDAHLLPVLASQLLPVVKSVKKAYGGIWEYLIFIGKKSGTSVLSDDE